MALSLLPSVGYLGNAGASVTTVPGAFRAGSNDGALRSGNVLGSNFRGSRRLLCRRSPRAPVLRYKLTTTLSVSFFESIGRLFSPAKVVPDHAQEFSVFEVNEFDRGSPVYLRRPLKQGQEVVNGVGDLVPYTNNVYDSQLKRKLGISAGITILIEHSEEKNGDDYEAIFSHYIGEYGSLSVQGKYLTYGDSVLGITSGTGIFSGANGIVKCHNINGPFKIIYTYYIRGIAKLPEKLTLPPVPFNTQIAKPVSTSTVKSA